MQSYLRDLVEEIGSKAIQIKMTIFPIDCKITFDVRRINFFLNQHYSIIQFLLKVLSLFFTQLFILIQFDSIEV